MVSTLTTASEWAASEFGGAKLGDSRRGSRLIRVAEVLSVRSQGTLPGTFNTWPETKSAYRLVETADVTYERIIEPHQARVRRACRQPGEYLLVEDTTSLDFSSHLAARDLGRIGNDGGTGLFVHTTLALCIERWKNDEPQVTVEGLFHQHWWARTAPKGRRYRSKRQKLEQPRESQRWAAVAMQNRPPAGVRWTFVADRESDIYETFERCEDNGWDFVVRASQRRALTDQDGSLFTAVARQQELGRFCVDLRARPGQAAREAMVAVRACTVTVRPPWRPGASVPPRSLQVVEAREVNAPAGVEPIHWVLLTNWPCKTWKQALRAIKAYTRRWLIEEYHKCLKSGTGIEESQLASAHTITALLGILAVVAVRLLNLKLLARTRPDEPSGGKDLGSEATRILEKTFGRPAQGWTNRSVLVAVARLGGFLARKGDGTPGCKTLWRGWHTLAILVRGYGLGKRERCG